MNAKIPSWLDSSAIMTLLCGEPGTETVRDLLDKAERKTLIVLVSTVSLTEVVAAVARVHGQEAARDDLRLLLDLPVQFVPPSADDCAAAGWLRAQYKLSTADAIIAAQAMAAGAELVHKDPELAAVQGLKQRRLPYKPAKR
ncbi:MAG: PIN domain-containing protein [Verrucomicrobiae bacterium]|nr:PIN domain-containing protein [Verrucomicrobiae bacterium]MDW7980000.1 PIN domain-containing protein [Verrucomicrobiales bacterium]MDW8309314.1 PIN domain-containing protein [Verrucomicrobiales bacterium]